MKINDQMIFIVGRSRSGTTLLSKIFNSHPQVAIPPEGIFLYNFYNKYKNKKNWTTADLKNLSNDILAESKMAVWNLTKNEIFQTLKHSNSNYYPELCLQVYKLWAEKNLNKKPLILGDQNPYYLFFVQKLSEIFPNAKFIFITRDYRDNILSLKNVNFDLNNTGALAYRYAFINKKGGKLLLKNAKNVYHIRYEDLVLKPKESLVNLCKNIKLPFDEKMLSFYENKEKEIRTWHKNLNTPLIKEKVGKWKNEMSVEDIKISDFYASRIGKQLNYMPISKINFKTFITSLPGYLLGILYSLIERSLFRLPSKWRIKIINYKRSNLNYE